MSPQWFLLLMLAVTLGAYGAHRMGRSRTRRGLRRLAASCQMHYVQDDLFNIAPRIEKNWPIPDCGEFRAVDLIYGTLAGEHRFVFSVHFTLGPLDGYGRELRVATFAESCDGCCKRNPTVILAGREGSLLDQYQRLLRGEVDS
ncbi:MAG: hypothetical protein ABSH20_08590 [Tepidisphaeraceae bacterium]|jgi:hypothetical protein